MNIRSTIFLGIHVNCIKYRSELQNMDAEHPLLYFFSHIPAELNFSTVIHVMNW